MSEPKYVFRRRGDIVEFCLEAYDPSGFPDHMRVTDVLGFSTPGRRITLAEGPGVTYFFHPKDAVESPGRTRVLTGELYAHAVNKKSPTKTGIVTVVIGPDSWEEITYGELENGPEPLWTAAGERARKKGRNKP